MAAVPPAAMVPGAAVGDGWCTWSEGSGAGEKTAAIARSTPPLTTLAVPRTDRTAHGPAPRISPAPIGTMARRVVVGLAPCE